MQEVYAATFEVKAPFAQVRDLITASWARFAETANFTAQKSDGRQANVWTLWSESSKSDRRHECRIVQAGGRVEVRFSIAAGLAGVEVRRLEVHTHSPDLVLDVIDKFPCMVGQRRVVSHAEDVNVAEVPHLKEILFDPTRRLPMVVLSYHLKFNELLVNPDNLAPDLAGVARVFVLKNERTTHAWSQAVGGNDWGVFNGAARIYWPRFKDTTNLHHHPLFLMEYAVPGDDEITANQIKRPILHAAIAEGRDTPILAEARKILQHEMRDNLKALNPEELRRRIVDLQDENDRLRAELAGAQERAVTAYVNVARGASKAADVKRNLAAAKTCTDILHLSSQVHDRLTFLESAWKGAHDVKSKHLDELWVTLYLLNELGLDVERRGGEFGTNWGPYFGESASRLGVRLPRFTPNDSKATTERFGGTRTFTVDGKPLLFRKHFTLGDADPEGCLQVYWELVEGRLVVGYAGLHLPYATAG